jgi:Cdc6-like AAA superfamily ATPase
MKKINYVHPSSKEGLPNLPENFYFPSHFLGLIIGKPGSGKTNLLKFILKENDLLFKKFDYIFIITPSISEYNDLFLPDDNFHNELNFEWIEEKINTLNNRRTLMEYINVLFILDDVVADLKSESTNKKLLSFVFNRRHKLINVFNFYINYN